MAEIDINERERLHEKDSEYKDTKPISTSVTMEEVDAEINKKLVRVYKYVGTVNSVSELPASSTVGYVYNVSDTGMNYAWDGTKWDALGSDVDLSDFVKNTDFATSNKGGCD